MTMPCPLCGKAPEGGAPVHDDDAGALTCACIRFPFAVSDTVLASPAWQAADEAARLAAVMRARRARRRTPVTVVTTSDLDMAGLAPA